MKARFVSWLIVLAATLPVAGAAQVSWRAKVSGSKLQSTGAPLGAGFVFELGAFRDNFIPTRENFSSWRDQFLALDSTNYNPISGIFAASTELATNGAPFGLGAPGYIWGNGPSGETILLTAPTWVWPNAGGAPGFPTNFFTSNSEAIAIIGSISNEEGAAVHLMTERPDRMLPPAYITWLSNFFTNAEQNNPVISGPAADADGDGNSNLQEFALGTDPRDAASALPIEIAYDGDVTALSVQASVRDEVTVSVESSSELASWSNDSTFIRDQFVASVLFSGSSSNRFFRLRFSF